MNKLIKTAIGVGVFLTMATPSFAACTNQTTGANSQNWCFDVSARIAAFKLDNFGTTTQVVNNSANTGYNLADKNTVSGGGVTSGAAGAETIKAATLNSNSVALVQSTGNVNSVTLGNGTTGYKSTNVAVNADIRAAVFGISNGGSITQVANTSANSGGNSASKNTVGGNVVSGAALSSTTVTSSLNTNTISITQ